MKAETAETLISRALERHCVGQKTWHECGMPEKRRLLDEYRFPGFRPRAEVEGVFGDSKARVIRLERRQKKRCAAAVYGWGVVFMISERGGFGIYRVERREFIWRSKRGEFSASGVRK